MIALKELELALLKKRVNDLENILKITILQLENPGMSRLDLLELLKANRESNCSYQTEGERRHGT